jgi:hypothetical protein
MIYIKDGDKQEPKTYYDMKELERNGYKLYIEPKPKPKKKQGKR